MSRKMLRLRLKCQIHTCYIHVEQHTYYQLSRYVFLYYLWLHLIRLAWDHQPRFKIHLAFSGKGIWIRLAPLTLSHTARLRAMAQSSNTWDMERERVETILACLLSSTEAATLSLWYLCIYSTPAFFFLSSAVLHRSKKNQKQEPRFYKFKKKKATKVSKCLDLAQNSYWNIFSTATSKNIPEPCIKYKVS